MGKKISITNGQIDKYLLQKAQKKCAFFLWHISSDLYIYIYIYIYVNHNLPNNNGWLVTMK